MIRLMTCVAAMAALATEARAAAPPMRVPTHDRYGDALPSGAVARLGTARLWLSRTWSAPTAALRFTPDDKTLLQFGPRMKRWDVLTGEPSAFPAPGQIEAATVTPDGKRLVMVVAPDAKERKPVRKLQHWDYRRREFMREAELPAEGGPIAFSRDGRLLAFAEGEQVVVFDDAARKTCAFAGSFSGASTGPSIAAFSADGTRLAVARADAVTVFDVRRRKVLRELKSADLRGGLASPHFSPDGTRLVAMGRVSLHLWDVESGKLLHRRPIRRPVETGELMSSGRVVQNEPTTGTAYSHDGRLVAVTDHTHVSLLDARDLKPVRSFRHHQRIGRALAFSHDDKKLALSDDHVSVWDVATGRNLLERDGHLNAVTSLIFSDDSQMLATGGSDGTACVWQVPGGRMLRRFRGHREGVPGLAFSPDGKTLATGEGPDGLELDGGEALVRLFDLGSGRPLRQFVAHLHSVHTLRFSPDGKRLASGGNDLRVKLWDATNGKPLWQARGYYAPVSFFDLGKSLLVCNFGYQFVTFDVASGERGTKSTSGRRQLSSGVVLDWPPTNLESRMGLSRVDPSTCFARFSALLPDNEREYSFDGRTRTEELEKQEDGRIALRDRESSRPFAEIAMARVLTFSPDGRWLAAADADSTVLLYDVEQMRVDHLCDELMAGVEDRRLMQNAAGVVRRMEGRLRGLLDEEARAVPHIEKLDDDDFDTREKADAELAKLGASVRLTLLWARQRGTSLEVRKRAARLLLRLKGGGPTAAGLESALAALHRLSDAGRQLVAELAEGPKGAAVAAAARRALKDKEGGR